MMVTESVHPAEAIKSNVYGTLNILAAAVRSGIRWFYECL
jgi:FlaA1/EpsC-like NDP-sugar epimerase